MKYIDFDKWQRKKHYNFFKDFDYPQFNICTNLEAGKFFDYIKANNQPVFKSILFAVMKSANHIENFKYRIREEGILIHDVIHPAFTVMAENDIYSNSFSKYSDDKEEFFKNVQDSIDYSKANIELDILKDNRDDVVYITCLPWLSFTGVSHPVKLSKTDSVPRISWGKLFEENGVIV